MVPGDCENATSSLNPAFSAIASAEIVKLLKSNFFDELNGVSGEFANLQLANSVGAKVRGFHLIGDILHRNRPVILFGLNFTVFSS